jgi:phenylalanyl-tRNA synthetase alpha chain
MTPDLISPDAYRKALSLRDLTDAALGPHAVQLLVHAAISALRDEWGCEVVLHRANPLVSIADNYERLGVPADAAARDARYTRYVTPTAVLRTHTTAMIPGLLRSLARTGYDDVLLACPGLVYRRDAIDRLHVGEPHQLDLWRLRAGRLEAHDLSEMVAIVVESLVPGAELRVLPADHPYTCSGLEIEVRAEDRWVEIAECGLAARSVLRRAGLGLRYEGLALGIGLDRVLMLRKGIDDIRLLRSDDERVASQLLDLEPYQPVSTQPPIRRDLSVAVAEETTAEELGDRVRSALGADATAVEVVEMLAETPLAALPRQAVERLGIGAGQKNALVRVVLRHPTRSLAAAEANRIRNEVYAAIHEGVAYEWASNA